MTGKRKNNKTHKIILLILIQIIIAILVSITTLVIYDKKVKKTYECENNLSSLVRKVNKSVVYIQIYKDDALYSSGTGFVYKTNAISSYIITNEHIIDNSEDVKVLLNDDEEIDAKVLGTNKYADIAVLKVDKKITNNKLKFGESKSTAVGDKIFLIGSPMGNEYKGTVSTGIVSGKDVNSTVLIDEKEWKMKSIQIEASVNPGNSGGPLFNMNGEVIGLITSKVSLIDIEGISFATPIDKVKTIIKELEEGNNCGEISLGIKVIDVEETSIIEANDIKVPKTKKGIVLLENSTKYDNLLKGDTIIGINDVELKDTSELKSELQYHVTNEIIKVKIERNNKIIVEEIKIK